MGEQVARLHQGDQSRVRDGRCAELTFTRASCRRGCSGSGAARSSQKRWVCLYSRYYDSNTRSSIAACHSVPSCERVTYSGYTRQMYSAGVLRSPVLRADTLAAYVPWQDEENTWRVSDPYAAPRQLSS